MSEAPETPPRPRDGWADAVAAAEAWGRNRSLAEHERALRQLCRAALEIVRSRPDADAVLAHRDPLPVSTLALIARLRERKR